MFDHVTLRVSSREGSESFYAPLLETLGVERTFSGEGLIEWDDFSLASASGERPPTRRLHLGLVAPSRAHVDEFWRRGRAAGHRDGGGPGPRPRYRHDYYGAFLLDPDGNSVEAVHHGALRRGGVIDHLWIRVADLAAAARFYALVARSAGFRQHVDAPERAAFGAGNGSFSLVPGEPTEQLHMAFAAPEDRIVDEFHRAAVAAGYADNGAPGERPAYHPGYYGAFVLDPDGNNVELVNHNRR